MALMLAETVAPKGAADIIQALLRADGAASHPYIACQLFVSGRDTARNLADAVHHLTTLHGRAPGIVDLAAGRADYEPAADWLDAATRGFEQERAYLARVVVAAGPIPSTPGQAESEAAVSGQRHALETLARSERTGCALGAAIALTMDWRAIRTIIDTAAQRFGVGLVPPALPSPRQTAAVLASTAGSSAVERAMVFGAQQIFVQNRGLWDLLDARQQARVGY
jgi:hypothetical protein